VRPWYYHSVKVILFIGLPVAVGGMLTSDQIVSILYEPSFVGAAVVLAILVWDIPVVMYHSFCGNMTTSIKREGGAARIYGTLGVVNVLLNLILIPRFGILGAAFSTVLTDFAGAAQFYLLFRHEFGPGLGFTRLIRLVGAVVIMGGLIVMLRSTDLLAFAEPIWLQFMLTAGAAGVIYVIVVWFSGAFSPQERARLTGFVIRRLRPRTA
jgi:O-antigen/teichoic acid export membrane protein